MNKATRKAIIAGNWKMNKTRPEAKELLEAIKPLVANAEGNANLANEGVSQVNADIAELNATVDALLGTEKETEVEADE